MRTSAAGNRNIAPILDPAWAAPGARARNARSRGFTLLELLVVVTIMALATAGVTLALRDNAQTTLEREALRLAVLFESARAQSRASGVAVYWHATAEGFRFEGLPSKALPARWMAEGTMVRGSPSVQLGPEPIIGPQAVELFSVSQSDRTLRVATDGLRPFTVQGPVQP